MSRPRPAARPAGSTPALTNLPWRSPALWVAALAACVSIAISVSYRIDDPDLWQHLAVGRWVWEHHAPPLVHWWTWPSWGKPDVNSSWGFEALLWPFWHYFELPGLFAWRWLTTLAAFGLLWAAARRMGARGLTPAFVLALCALTYRQRSDLRPETFSAVLFAAELWVLETRRSGGPDRSAWLVPIAWIWANTHVSWYLGIGTVGLYLLEAAWRAPRSARPLAITFGACVAVSFLNPFGWRALAEPFQFVLSWRHEAVFQNIPELMPPRWSVNWQNGLPLLIAGWPLLAAWRATRRGIDPVEVVLVTLFTLQAVSARRFIGIYALAAAPFVSRDLSELLATVRAGRVPWPLSVRAAGVALASFAIGPLEWSRWDLPLGLSMDHASYPMRACDFMAEQGVRGRGLNTFGMASWQVFRFAGDRWQLPFIDIHQSGTRTDRDLYAAAQVDPAAWRALDALHRFDYALLARVQYGGDQLLDALDADSAFALIFKDDAAALYVRRHGPLEPVAARFAYRVVAAGRIGIGRLGEICARDSSLRGPVRAELGREVEESPWHGQATSLLANLALLEADWPHARALLDTVEMIDPGRQRVHLRLGLLDQIDGRPHEALRQFAREKEIFGGSLDLDLAEARSHAALGETGRASDAWRRALRRDPANAEAAESLAVWERRRTG